MTGGAPSDAVQFGVEEIEPEAEESPAKLDEEATTQTAWPEAEAAQHQDLLLLDMEYT